jgi:hypothetical protein
MTTRPGEIPEKKAREHMRDRMPRTLRRPVVQAPWDRGWNPERQQAYKATEAWWYRAQSRPEP